jgi:hypothetical protein
VSLNDAFVLLEHALHPAMRVEILDAVPSRRGYATAMEAMRKRMRAHTFPTSGSVIALEPMVRDLDRRTTAEGFHALQSWDYRAHHFVGEPTAILMLNRVAGRGAPAIAERTVLATLSDQYFLWILGLVALRAWDEGDPNENLNRVTALLGLLKTSSDGAPVFVENAALLLLLAVSQYHPQEKAYSNLLDRVRSLDDRHRAQVALCSAATLGGHLRWGFRFMYHQDYQRMRDDNIVDYPWLLFAVETLLEQYCEAVDRGASDSDVAMIAAALMNGLTADPWILVDEQSLSSEVHRSWRRRVCDRIGQCSQRLLTHVAAHRPDLKAYSPLSFEYNFLHNVIVGMIEVATTQGASPGSLDSLLTAVGDEATPVLGSARRLARYAACAAQAAGGPPLIVYDSFNSSKYFDVALDALRRA